MEQTRRHNLSWTGLCLIHLDLCGQKEGFPKKILSLSLVSLSVEAKISKYLSGFLQRKNQVEPFSGNEMELSSRAGPQSFERDEEPFNVGFWTTFGLCDILLFFFAFMNEQIYQDTRKIEFYKLLAG